MVTSASMTGSVKSAGLYLLLLSFLLYMADSYPNVDLANTGCEECALRRYNRFSGEHPIYQCRGCCFSMAFPTPLSTIGTMANRKNITSQATCCVASHSNVVKTEVGRITLRNHTDCHCSTCRYHKI